MCVLSGLVWLDLSLGGGLDGDDDEVVGVVSGCEKEKICVFIKGVCLLEGVCFSGVS